MKEYKPKWPGTVMLWGAEATAALGFKTTGEIRQEFRINGFKRVKELREYYDWNSLRKIMKACPNYKNDKMEIQDLFNIIDMHIFEKGGFYVSDKRGYKIDSKIQDIWYPLNETVVQRLNDPEQPKLSFGFKAKSKEEENAVNNNQTDFIQCPFCGTMVSSINTPIVMQSNFKGNYPPSIENIQRDMRISVENAEHILLMGYTLPKDDVIYRSMFAAKINRGGKHVCSVVVGKDKKFPDRWICGAELEKYIKNISNDDSFINAVSSAFDIFGKENVRGYVRGIPDVFLKNGRVDEGRVKNLIRQWSNGDRHL